MYNYSYRIFRSRRFRIALTLGTVLVFLIYLHFFDMDIGDRGHISAGTAVALVFGIQSLLVLLFPKYMEEARRYEIESLNPIRRFFRNGWKVRKT